MNTNELYHYGVPGMKWGVRRAEDDGIIPFTLKPPKFIKFDDEETYLQEQDKIEAKKAKAKKAAKIALAAVGGTAIAAVTAPVVIPFVYGAIRGIQLAKAGVKLS